MCLIREGCVSANHSFEIAHGLRFRVARARPGRRRFSQAPQRRDRKSRGVPCNAAPPGLPVHVDTSARETGRSPAPDGTPSLQRPVAHVRRRPIAGRNVLPDGDQAASLAGPRATPRTAAAVVSRHFGRKPHPKRASQSVRPGPRASIRPPRSAGTRQAPALPECTAPRFRVRSGSGRTRSRRCRRVRG